MTRRNDRTRPEKRRNNSFTRALVWLIMGMLVVGLGGFGVTNFGSSRSAIGWVGDEEISVNQYALVLQQELRALGRQTGESVSLLQADSMSQLIHGQGVSDRVLDRLYATAALDDEAGRVGISAGDAEVQEQVVGNPVFQGLNGEFDREAYRSTLDRNRLSEREFEESVRKDLSRTILQNAVSGGVTAPDTIADALLAYAAERRSFRWARIDESTLDAPLPEPTEEQLQAYYEAHPGDFTTEEIKRITYVWLTPDMLLETIKTDEEALKSLYKERIGEYRVPERRLVERLVFENDEAAAAAHTRLVGEDISFDAMVSERGLSLSDIDLGDVTAEQLGDAAAAVFALETPGDFTDPQPSVLGPAIYRMNGVLNARETSYEDARPDLLSEYALDRARSTIANQVSGLEDLLAEGATLEEIADETELVLERTDWSDQGSDQAEDDITGYEAFRQAASRVTEDDFAEIAELEDGGVFALRLDEVIPPTLQPFDTVRSTVASGRSAAQTQQRLDEQAGELASRLNDGASFEELGLTARDEKERDRNAFVEGTPPAFIAEVFEMTPDEARPVSSEGAALIVQLDEILPPDPEEAGTSALAGQLDDSIASSIAQDIFAAYVRALQLDAAISRDQAAINAINAQFP